MKQKKYGAKFPITVCTIAQSMAIVGCKGTTES